MKTEAKKFATESELCDDLAGRVRAAGWKCFPEFGGFDLYLVTPTGDHVGVEAKLRPNLRVLAQIAGRDFGHTGPDFLAVLVPDTTPDFSGVCAVLGAAVFTRHHFYRPHDSIRLIPEDRPELPLVEETRKAGTASPVRTTRWKQLAVRLIAMLDVRGSLTRRDIKAVGIDARLWINKRNGWLMPSVTPGHFVINPASRAIPNIREQHPELLQAEIRRVTGKPNDAT